MKKLLLIFLLFQASFTFAQVEGETGTYIKDCKTYGYVNGVRLDSINMEYAEFGNRRGSLFFDYGQKGNRKSKVITDKKGIPLLFTEPNTNFVLWLNFLAYNGWDYLPNPQMLNLLKKKKYPVGDK